MEAGKYPKVTPRSATAKKTMNQLVVFLKNLLLLAMMKIIQVIPTRPKKAMNQPPIQYQTNFRRYFAGRLNLDLMIGIISLARIVKGSTGVKSRINKRKGGGDDAAYIRCRIASMCFRFYTQLA